MLLKRAKRAELTTMNDGINDMNSGETMMVMREGHSTKKTSTTGSGNSVYKTGKSSFLCRRNEQGIGKCKEG